MTAIQAKITHFLSVRKEKLKIQKETRQVQKSLAAAESHLSDRKQQLDQQLETVRVKKQELEKKESQWLCPSVMWKNQGLEVIMLEKSEEKVKADPRTPQSGDDPNIASPDRIADGLYQIMLSDLPDSKQTFKIKIRYEKGCFSILEADSKFFSVSDLERIESTAKDDSLHLVVLLRHHIVSKLSQ